MAFDLEHMKYLKNVQMNIAIPDRQRMSARSFNSDLEHAASVYCTLTNMMLRRFIMWERYPHKLTGKDKIVQTDFVRVEGEYY